MFKTICVGKVFIYSVDVNCCLLSVRQRTVMRWHAKWALVRLITVIVAVVGIG